MVEKFLKEVGFSRGPMIEIQSNQALAELCREASQQEFITFDTEFIRERTYYPILALLQVSWETQAPVLIDPLKITDWGPFHEVLKNPQIVKVFHAGRQDLEIFYYQMGDVAENLFDTQIAASMCGFGEQIGYSGLVARMLGVQIPKGSSYTNWLQRPLTKAQLHYARDDVLHLPEIYAKLVKKAKSKNRMEWVCSEIKRQLQPSIFNPDPDQLWRKIKKLSSLNKKHLVVLQALARWRDEAARSLDKPVRFLFTDEVMIELSKIDVLTQEALGARRGMTTKFLQKFGASIIECHRKARAKPRDQWPKLQNAKIIIPSDKSEALADLAWLFIKSVAFKSDIAPAYLINKRMLPQFIETYLQEGDLTQFPIGKGWREEVIGEPLRKLIDGKLVVKVENHNIIWHEKP